MSTDPKRADRRPNILLIIEEPAIPAWVVALLVTAALIAVVAILLLVLRGPGGPLAVAPTPTATPTVADEAPSPEGEAATSEATLEPTPPGTEEPTVSATLEPTSEPTAEPTAASPTDTPAPPTPTATTAPTWTPCPVPVDAALAPLWDRRTLGCPLGPAALGSWAVQTMERGIMFWSQERDSILMIANNGRWMEVPDYWHESKPELSCSATPPEGLIQPKRGFGLAWCTQPEMRDALGYALIVEEPTDVRLQTTAADYIHLLYHIGHDSYLLLPDWTWTRPDAP